MKSFKVLFLFSFVFAALPFSSSFAIEPPYCPLLSGSSYAELSDGVQIIFATGDQRKIVSFSASRNQQWVLIHEDSQATHELIVQERTQKSPYLYSLRSEQEKLEPGHWYVDGLEELIVNVPVSPFSKGISEADAVLHFPWTRMPDDIYDVVPLASWASRVMVTLPEAWQDKLSENVLLQGRMIVDPIDPTDPTSEGMKTKDVFASVLLDPQSGKYVTWLDGSSWSSCTGPGIPDWEGGSLMVGWLKPAADDESQAQVRFELDLSDANAMLSNLHKNNDSKPDSDLSDKPVIDNNDDNNAAPETSQENKSSNGCSMIPIPSSKEGITPWAFLFAGLFVVRRYRKGY